MPENQNNHRSSRNETRNTILISIITAVAGIITTLIVTLPQIKTCPPCPEPISNQGLHSLSIKGKWKYVCTDYNGLYQHGGRFTVDESSDGTFQLVGERMWKDIYDTVNKKWICTNFKDDKILPWESTWIYVHDKSQFNMEYEITSNGNVIKGYCTGRIKADNEIVDKIDGYFHQLLPKTPLLAGRIVFQRVSDSEYYSLNWKKNHTCSKD